MTYAYTTRVRSFALVTSSPTRNVPNDAVLIDGQPVFRFPPDETEDAIDRFVSIKRRLAAIERSVCPAGSSEPALASSGSTL